MKLSLKQVLYILSSIILFLLVIYLSNLFSTEEISSFLSKTGILAPIVYILIQTVGQIFAPLSTSALFVAGFVIFGKNAIWYAVVTWLISSFTNFWIARRYGKRILKLFIGEKGIEKIEYIASKITKRRFFVLRLSTFYINDFASYAFGLTNISFVTYYLTSIVSMIPWLLIVALVMKEGDSILLTTSKIFLSMIPFALISYIYLKGKKKK